jgi:NAD(P)H-hydrate repair Nnr-like enzyme with NAD(P)H-hydrate dehydratase domain
VTLLCIKQVIEHAKGKNKPLIIDADGLYLIQKNPELIKGYPDAILTPNFVEYERLCIALGVSIEDGVSRLCNTLQSSGKGPVIVRKGMIDVISDGTVYKEFKRTLASPRRYDLLMVTKDAEDKETCCVVLYLFSGIGLVFLVRLIRIPQ